MADTKWTGFLTYRAKHTDIDSELKGSFVPVSQFAVKAAQKERLI